MTKELACFLLVLLVAAPRPQERGAAPSPLVTRTEKEALLLKGNIVDEGDTTTGSKFWRVTLGDGTRKHDAAIETSTLHDPSQRDYRFNVAAYELDKALELNFVAPSVERAMKGQPAAFTWWVDDVLMNEQVRRGKKIEPPDPDGWKKQMQTVRVFDELIANAYRNVSPAFYMAAIWDNLLITKDWRIWLVDHTRAFATSRTLENPETLAQCDRALLTKMRELPREVIKERLEKYLTPEQLDALEVRRGLLVKHFAERIALQGEGAVLYDLPSRQSSN
ncbi:MAG: hypothetical protein QOJ80_1400 [Mycobacterium sp.]|nr:hypothetical protein [Mycobacterium sp.]